MSDGSVHETRSPVESSTRLASVERLALIQHISDDKASLDKVNDRLSAADYMSRKQADDQSHIARMVLDLFRWSVAVIFVLLTFEFAARLYGVAIDNTSLVREVIDFVKVAILPLVTLVLGFYFGRLDSSRKDHQK